MPFKQPNRIQKFSPREMQRLLRHAYTPLRRVKRFRGGTGKVGKEWIIAEMQLLGTMSDKEAARRLKRTHGDKISAIEE